MYGDGQHTYTYIWRTVKLIRRCDEQYQSPSDASAGSGHGRRCGIKTKSVRGIDRIPHRTTWTRVVPSKASKLKCGAYIRGTRFASHRKPIRKYEDHENFHLKLSSSYLMGTGWNFKPWIVPSGLNRSCSGRICIYMSIINEKWYFILSSITSNRLSKTILEVQIMTCHDESHFMSFMLREPASNDLLVLSTLMLKPAKVSCDDWLIKRVPNGSPARSRITNTAGKATSAAEIQSLCAITVFSTVHFVTFGDECLREVGLLGATLKKSLIAPREPL